MRIIPVSPIKQTVNYLSDFELEMQLMGLNGEDVVSPLLLDWELDFYTGSGETYKASFKNGKATNCIVGEDTITVIFDNHKMGVGTLNVISTVYFPDSRYPDGSRKVVDRGSTGVSLTFENNQPNTTLTAQLVLPAYIKDLDRFIELYGDAFDVINERLEKILGEEYQPPAPGGAVKVKSRALPCDQTVKVIHKGYLKNTSQPGVYYRNKGFIGVVFKRISGTNDGVAEIPEWMGKPEDLDFHLTPSPSSSIVPPTSFENNKVYINDLFGDIKTNERDTNWYKITLFVVIQTNNLNGYIAANNHDLHRSATNIYMPGTPTFYARNKRLIISPIEPFRKLCSKLTPHCHPSKVEVQKWKGSRNKRYHEGLGPYWLPRKWRKATSAMEYGMLSTGIYRLRAKCNGAVGEWLYFSVLAGQRNYIKISIL